MPVKINATACAKDVILPLIEYGADIWPTLERHFWLRQDKNFAAPVGATLRAESAPQTPAFMVVGYEWLVPPAGVEATAIRCPMLQALIPIPGGGENYLVSAKGYSLAVVTLSDKGAAGLREDRSGPLIVERVSSALPLRFSRRFLIADDYQLLRALLLRLAIENRYDLIFTTGGTGLGPRDFTPQATASLLDLPLPGFTAAMTNASLNVTPMGAISRAAAGVIAGAIVVNLPGSPRAAKENLAPLLPALDHALKKLKGDAGDCGGARAS